MESSVSTSPATEQVNESSLDLDKMDTATILKTINNEDRKVADAVSTALPQITTAVDAIVHGLRSGGRLIYVGCGTSGRLGVLDASECAVTFGIESGRVIGVIAGGDEALRRSMEKIEDNEQMGAEEVEMLKLSPSDIVVGIATSGRTPFVLGAVKFANQIGCCTICICCNPSAPLIDQVVHPVVLLVGPEVLAGSTRMKAGTATKMVLNMMSTASLVRMGRCYGAYMVGMHANACDKLKRRAVVIMQQITGCSSDRAKHILSDTNYNLKAAIVMQLKSINSANAERLLVEHDGVLRDALEA